MISERRISKRTNSLRIRTFVYINRVTQRARTHEHHDEFFHVKVSIQPRGPTFREYRTNSLPFLLVAPSSSTLPHPFPIPSIHRGPGELYFRDGVLSPVLSDSLPKFGNDWWPLKSGPNLVRNLFVKASWNLYMTKRDVNYISWYFFWCKLVQERSYELMVPSPSLVKRIFRRTRNKNKKEKEKSESI